jgi:recombination protein RecA
MPPNTKKANKAADLAAAREGGKAAALEAFLKQQDKDNPGEITLLNDDRIRVNIRTVSTGAIGVDVAVNGGIPFGRITELYGPEGGGKTSLALAAAKHCQDEGGIIGFVDAENGLNRELCKAIGIDESRFVVSQPGCGEEAMEHVDSMLESGAFDMIIVDSVAAMVPRAELEGEIDQNFVGLHARLMAKWMRRVTAEVNQRGVALVLINQVRTDMSNSYMVSEKSTGGKAIKFFASLRLKVTSNLGGKKITRGNEVIGQTVSVRVEKNRLGAPARTAEFDLIFGKGIDGSSSLLQVCEDMGIVTRAGASYTEVATGERIGVGKDNLKAKLSSPEGKELADRLTDAVYAVLNNRDTVEVPEDADERAEVEAEFADELGMETTELASVA